MATVQVAHGPLLLARYKSDIETGYFVANILLLAVAVVAGKLAHRQLREATRSRTGQIYFQIMESWESPKNKRSRQLISGLQQFYDANHQNWPQKYGSAGEYIKVYLLYLKEADPTSYLEHIGVLAFFEFLGLMLRKDYASRDDVLEFFAGSTKLLLDLLEPFLIATQDKVAQANEERKAQNQPPAYLYPRAVFANALWLRRYTGKYYPYQYRS